MRIMDSIIFFLQSNENVNLFLALSSIEFELYHPHRKAVSVKPLLVPVDQTNSKATNFKRYLLETKTYIITTGCEK